MLRRGKIVAYRGFAYDINDSGHIVGAYEPTQNSMHRAFLYVDGAVTSLGTLGGSHSAAYAINNKGQIVGVSTTSSNQFHAFLWENGVMEDLGTLGGSSSMALDINDHGQIVGSARIASGQNRAFIYIITVKLFK